MESSAAGEVKHLQIYKQTDKTGSIFRCFFLIISSHLIKVYPDVANLGKDVIKSFLNKMIIKRSLWSILNYILIHIQFLMLANSVRVAMI